MSCFGGIRPRRVLVVAFDEKSLIYYRRIQQKPRNRLITTNAERIFDESSVTHNMNGNKELCYAVRSQSPPGHSRVIRKSNGRKELTLMTQKRGA